HVFALGVRHPVQLRRRRPVLGGEARRLRGRRTVRPEANPRRRPQHLFLALGLLEAHPLLHHDQPPRRPVHFGRQAALKQLRLRQPPVHLRPQPLGQLPHVPRRQLLAPNLDQQPRLRHALPPAAAPSTPRQFPPPASAPAVSSPPVASPRSPRARPAN